MAKDEKKSVSPTIVDVARESGVSYSTVSRVLNGYEFVRPDTREKVLRVANQLGYVPNQQARSLAGGRSNLIGALVPNLTNGYISEIIHGIDDELAKSGYNLILYTTHRHEGRERTYVATIANGAADGLVLVVPLLSTTYLDALRQQDFPYVLIDQFDTSEQSNMINGTNRQGAYEATDYLIQLGHRRIAFITGQPGLNSSAERFEGYQQALANHGLALADELIVQGDFWETGGYNAGRELLALPNRPTAIFAANDLSALGAIEAIREAGLRIPQDISIVGFDDISQASLISPKLTTVRQPLVQMGRMAVAMLLETIAQPDAPLRQEIVPTELIIRDSCQPPAQALD
jgi:LacI family transcriptional regulator